MSRHSKVTDRMRKRIAELNRDGMSLRAIARQLTDEGMKISYDTVSVVLSAPAKDAPASVPGAKSRAAARPPRPAAPLPRPTPRADAEADDGDLEQERQELDVLLARRPEALPRLPADASLPAREVWWTLAQARRMALDVYLAVGDGRKSATEWKPMAELYTKLAQALRDLLPPPTPDPAKDPTNIAAREMVRSHTLQVVEAVELRSGRLCPRCSKAVA